MSSDTQFTALGPTAIGFQCHGANITIGGHLFGINIGCQARGNLAVEAVGGATGCSAPGDQIGVDAFGPIGVARRKPYTTGRGFAGRSLRDLDAGAVLLRAELRAGTAP